MTCYMRHMAWLFDALGVADDTRNRKRVDAALRAYFEMGDDAHCPEIWAAVKALSLEERDALIPAVGDALDAAT